MSRKRQSAEAAIALRTLAVDYSSGYRIHRHEHPWGQLIYASDGVMSVETDHGTWVVPPRRAVWVPPAVPHEIEMSGSVAMRTVYLRPDLTHDLPEGPCVVHVTPLLRELILHAVGEGYLEETNPAHRRLIGVILDQLAARPEVPLALPSPSDRRARSVADRVRGDPADSRPLSELAAGSGASPRTLERLFRSETGMSFGRWRRQVRLLHALRVLAGGASVTTAALHVGYDSTSAFIAMFRLALGTTPGKYYAARA